MRRWQKKHQRRQQQATTNMVEEVLSSPVGIAAATTSNNNSDNGSNRNVNANDNNVAVPIIVLERLCFIILREIGNGQVHDRASRKKSCG